MLKASMLGEGYGCNFTGEDAQLRVEQLDLLE